MIQQVIGILTLFTVALAAEAYGRLDTYSDYKQSYRPYDFSYQVTHDPSYLNFGHEESADSNGVVTGSYHVLLPDGRTQTVKYTADVNGYTADVTYTGVPNYDYTPSPSSKYDVIHYDTPEYYPYNEYPSNKEIDYETHTEPQYQSQQYDYLPYDPHYSSYTDGTYHGDSLLTPVYPAYNQHPFYSRLTPNRDAHPKANHYRVNNEKESHVEDRGPVTMDTVTHESENSTLSPFEDSSLGDEIPKTDK